MVTFFLDLEKTLSRMSHAIRVSPLFSDFSISGHIFKGFSRRLNSVGTGGLHTYQSPFRMPCLPAANLLESSHASGWSVTPCDFM